METLPQLLNSLKLLSVATAVLLATITAVTASAVMLAEETLSFFNVFAICITAAAFLTLINSYFSN